MSIRNRSVQKFLGVWLSVALLAACSINVKKNKDGDDKNVDINTPMGGIHVSDNAQAKDTGLSVYPGAHLRAKDGGGDDQNANVNISGFGFGVKVVAVEYSSDDPPSKLFDFYRGQLKKYGSVLECHTSGNVNYSHTGDGHGSKDLKCEGDNTGKNLELKAGSDNDQHIVSIEPNGSGTNFTLIYVRTHGKEVSI